VHKTYWITENAWRAHRDGVGGWLVDLETGTRESTRARLERLVTELEPYAARFDGADHLSAARALLAGNGSDRQRVVHARHGLDGLTRWLVEETERSADG
jgi:gamma-glutamyl:cysteine ligase YbdK (ATP-grasp superfamily)